MKFDKTVQKMQELGSSVVDKGKAILKKKKKTTSSNTLYNGFDYLVGSDANSVFVEWKFGGANDYWAFVDEGVKGAGGFKGSGKMRGQGSDFRFGSGKARGNWADFKKSIKKWIKNKPLKLRGAKGKFIKKNKANINSAAFLIQRAIYQRGLERTRFFSKPYEQELAIYENQIIQAFAEDLELELKKRIENK